jgi:threonine dehydratase
MSPRAPLGLAEVEEAAKRLAAFLQPTPVVRSLSEKAWLKLENVQKTGAYKVRGALNALLLQRERGDSRPVIAASAGNHGAGVAWAAQQLGMRATIIVPKGAPRTKVIRIERYGAEVQYVGDDFDQSLDWAQQLACSQGARFLHAFDDPDIIAGQGTTALELLQLKPDVVIVPIGGGGLASGCCIPLRDAGVRVVGVQIEGVDALASYLRGGPGRILPRETIADGLRVREAGVLTRELCRRGLSEIVLVTEEQVKRSQARLAAVERITAEGAGAVAFAALPQVKGEKRVAIVSGGNSDNVSLRQRPSVSHLNTLCSNLLF